jgi:hypothetical protein
MTCTVPKLLKIQDWFDTRFGDLCATHDQLYVLRTWKMKLYADCWIAGEFCKRGYCTIGLLSLPYNLAFGSIYWKWKKHHG